MSEYASNHGTDIHAGIIDSIFIDHATGIVIGETTVIEKGKYTRGNLRGTQC
jgi:serine O-acetyltransferase